jgi:Domain of unknown function (DUF5655)
MAHSCGPHTVEAFLEGKGPKALALWEALLDKTQLCGPFDLAPAKTRVAFMVRVRFLAVTALSDRGITFHIWLRKPAESSLFFRVDHLASGAHVHWARVRAPEDLSQEMGKLICLSYQIGAGRA